MLKTQGDLLSHPMWSEAILLFTTKDRMVSRPFPYHPRYSMKLSQTHFWSLLVSFINLSSGDMRQWWVECIGHIQDFSQWLNAQLIRQDHDWHWTSKMLQLSHENGVNFKWKISSDLEWETSSGFNNYNKVQNKTYLLL